ncbi:hypothetical protein ACLB2K_054958 [Fragaria x ananassa]
MNPSTLVRYHLDLGMAEDSIYSGLPWLRLLKVRREENKFTSVSCGRIASLTFPEREGQIMAVCLSICDEYSPALVNNTCNGINCCQTSIPFSTYGVLNTSFGPLINGSGSETSACKYAFLVDPEWFTSHSTNTSAIADRDGLHINECEDPKRPNICGSAVCSNIDGTFECYTYNPQPQSLQPIKLAIVVLCSVFGLVFVIIGVWCSHKVLKKRKNIKQPTTSVIAAYNPQPQSLQPIKLAIVVLCSVFGLVFVIIGVWCLHKVLKKRKNIKHKQKFYTQNGGFLLEKLLSSGEINVEKIKLFDAKELEKATDRFNADIILGEGGQGTVYKGMLTDGRIVAVKKSKIADRGEVCQFINEIFILSQINHRNVVKLLGCCLESEVPLLVYEFLPNGTLSQYIHSRDEDFPLTWEIRLRVGTEVAGALSYLHSSASMPIYHRDIKSSNILLDEKHRAKVADFGTSRSVSIDQTHLTMTHVNGTFGYLDPEYFQSSQFTDKSDVYSLGVVLAELLTGQKPVSVTRSEEGRQEGRSLATYFIVSMEENFLFDILDAEVMKGGKKEEIMAVANLAKRCLHEYERKEASYFERREN